MLCGLHALRKQRNLRYDTIDHTTPPDRGERGNMQSCSFSNPWSTRRLFQQSMVSVSPFHAMRTLIMTIPRHPPPQGSGGLALPHVPGSRISGHPPLQGGWYPISNGSATQIHWFSEGNRKETSNCPCLVLQCACLRQCGAAGSSIIAPGGLHVLTKQRNLQYDTIDHPTPPNRGERGNLRNCFSSNPWSTCRPSTQ